MLRDDIQDEEEEVINELWELKLSLGSSSAETDCKFPTRSGELRRDAWCHAAHL